MLTNNGRHSIIEIPFCEKSTGFPCCTYLHLFGLAGFSFYKKASRQKSGGYLIRIKFSTSSRFQHGPYLLGSAVLETGVINTQRNAIPIEGYSIGTGCIYFVCKCSYNSSHRINHLHQCMSTLCSERY